MLKLRATALVLLLSLAGTPSPTHAQELPAEAPLSEEQATDQRILEIQRRQESCKDDCQALQALLQDLQAYREELAAHAQANTTLERQKAERDKELEALLQEPAEFNPAAAQNLSPGEIEVLEQEVRLGTLDLGGRQGDIEKGLSELTRLRRRQEELARELADLAAESATSDTATLWLEERKTFLQKRRDLAGERIKNAMESLELGRQRLATTEDLLARRSGRLSGVRLSAGIPAQEIQRTRDRVEQLREAVAQRAVELEAQMHQVEENLTTARQTHAEAQQKRNDLESSRPTQAGPAMEAWKREVLLAEDMLAAAQGQQDALNAARDLVLESSHLDEFLLAIQATQLQHDEDFNGLLQLIRDASGDPGPIEKGLERFQDSLAALRAEMQALEITSDKLRGEIQLASEQVRHTALRLDSVLREAQAAEGADDHLNSRVEQLEALLNRQQAWSEGLTSRRSLIEEALHAANDQLKKYQDSVNLLSGYVSGSLRFNFGTLVQALDWTRQSALMLIGRIAQAPAYWLELRLSLQQESRRARFREAGLFLGLTALGLLLVDWLLARLLRRQRQALKVSGKANWLFLSATATPGNMGGFLMPEAEPRPVSQPWRRAMVYILSRIHRPLQLGLFCLLGLQAVPELQGFFLGLSILALIILFRRLGGLGVMMLVSQDPAIPSLRLAPAHATFLTRWSFWLLLLVPPLLGAYVAAQWFSAPVSVRLTLGLAVLAVALFFVLVLVIHGRARVVQLIQVQSVREKPSLPVLLYNRLIAQVYLLSLVVVLAVIGFYATGYAETARYLAVAFIGTVALITGVALLVRGLHLWLRRRITANPVWADLGTILLHLSEALLVICALLGILLVWGVDLAKLSQEIRYQLDREIFKTADGRSIRLVSVAWVLLLLVLTLWISRRTRDLLQKRVFPYLSIDRGQQISLSLVLHYTLLLLSGLIGLNMLGINLTALSVVFGALSLGIGFGLQTIVNNFVSGLILLFERNIRPDDIIDFGGTRVKVEEVRTRCTIVIDEDNKPWIVPNVRFMNETITNWSRNWARVRYILTFFVLPDTDVHRLRQVVNAWVTAHPDIIQDPPPELRLLEIQLGSMRLGLYICTTDAWPFSRTRSRVYLELIELLQREGFKMPLPESRIQYYSPMSQLPPVPDALPLGPFPPGMVEPGPRPPSPPPAPGP